MKVYARQISPENQEPLMLMNDSFFPDNIAVFGNRHYKEHLPDVFHRVRLVLEQGELDEVLMEVDAGASDPILGYADEAEAVNDFLPPVDRDAYSPTEINFLAGHVLAYSLKGSRQSTILALVLSIVTGHQWETATIRGCCQSDWQEVCYRVDEWSREDLNRFEAEYFNMGTEWTVEEFEDTDEQPADPSDICGWSIYCTADTDEAIRAEIAEAAMCDPSEVVMYKWTGYRRVNVYEEI